MQPQFAFQMRGLQIRKIHVLCRHYQVSPKDELPSRRPRRFWVDGQDQNKQWQYHRDDKRIIGSVWKGFSCPFKVNHCINCQKRRGLLGSCVAQCLHENSLSSLRRGKSSKVSFASIGRGVAGAEDNPPSRSIMCGVAQRERVAVP